MPSALAARCTLISLVDGVYLLFSSCSPVRRSDIRPDPVKMMSGRCQKVQSSHAAAQTESHGRCASSGTAGACPLAEASRLFLSNTRLRRSMCSCLHRTLVHQRPCNRPISFRVVRDQLAVVQQWAKTYRVEAHRSRCEQAMGFHPRVLIQRSCKFHRSQAPSLCNCMEDVSLQQRINCGQLVPVHSSSGFGSLPHLILKLLQCSRRSLWKVKRTCACEITCFKCTCGLAVSFSCVRALTLFRTSASFSPKAYVSAAGVAWLFQ